MAAKLSVLFVVAFAASSLGTPSSRVYRGKFVTDGRGEERLTRIQHFAHELAQTVKNLEVSPDCHLKVRDAAKEIIFTTQTAVFSLNHAIPSVKNDKLRKSLVEISDSFAELAHEVQVNLHGNIEALKKSLGESLEKTCELAKKVAEILKTQECKDEFAVANQLRECITELTFGANKLKFELTFLKKTVPEISQELDVVLAQFNKALHSLKTDDPRSHDELNHMAQDVEALIGEAIIKLQNYLHISPEHAKNFEIVKEVLKGLSASCEGFQRLACSDEDVTKIVAEYTKLAQETVQIVKKLAQCDVTSDSLGELYIRGLFFDLMTIAHVHEVQISHLNNTPPKA